MEQAVNILFSTDMGELRLHPQYGVRFPIGTKGELHNIVEFKLHTKAAILRDDRVSDVPYLAYKLQDGVLYVKSKIQLKSISQLLTTTAGTRL
jgi:phage baseplate assembly protein W